MSIQAMALVFLVTVSVGATLWVLLYPAVSGDKTVEERLGAVSIAEPVRKASARGPLKTRREQVEDTLKEIDARRKMVTKPTLAVQLARAGLGWSKQKFFVISALSGVLGGVVVMLSGAGPLPAAAAGFAAALGLPRWLLGYLRRRRETAFIANFPDAVDVIVRGIKAGLPLFDSIKVIVTDAPEPIRSEFRGIVETQTIGVPLGEACTKLYERIPIAEANFFGIVVAIQQQSGGNLSEALGNLSRVLRDRKKMKEKIKAMSTEAKASAAIIASLPPLVMLIVYVTSPNYIALLWTHPTGNIMLGASALWMMVGVGVMKKMISFDF